MLASLAARSLFAATIILAGCGNTPRLIEKNAQSDEIRKETSVGVPLPPGCPTLTASVPAGKQDVTISYQEPKTDQKGKPLIGLSHTTIYLTSSGGETRSIRIWTTDTRGGATVTVRNIIPPAQKFGVCATATNQFKQESAPATAVR